MAPVFKTLQVAQQGKLRVDIVFVGNLIMMTGCVKNQSEVKALSLRQGDGGGDGRELLVVDAGL